MGGITPAKWRERVGWGGDHACPKAGKGRLVRIKLVTKGGQLEPEFNASYRDVVPFMSCAEDFIRRYFDSRDLGTCSADASLLDVTVYDAPGVLFQSSFFQNRPTHVERDLPAVKDCSAPQ